MLPGNKLIISYCRIIGNTFFGWTYHGEYIKQWKVIFYKLWNICLIILVGVPFAYGLKMNIDFNQEHKLKNLLDSKNKTNNKIDMFNLLFLTSNITFSLQGLFNAIYLLVFGSKMMNLLIKHDTGKIDPLWEHKLAKLIILAQIVYPVMTNIFFTFTILMLDRNFSLLSLSPSIYLSTSNQILILSIISYKSLLIRKQLVNFSIPIWT